MWKTLGTYTTRRWLKQKKVKGQDADVTHWKPPSHSVFLHPSLFLSPSLPPFRPAASHSLSPYEYKWRQFLVMNVSLSGSDATLVNNWRKMSEKLRSAVLMCLRLGSPAANHRQPLGWMEMFPSHSRPYCFSHFKDWSCTSVKKETRKGRAFVILRATYVI